LVKIGSRRVGARGLQGLRHAGVRSLRVVTQSDHETHFFSAGRRLSNCSVSYRDKGVFAGPLSWPSSLPSWPSVVSSPASTFTASPPMVMGVHEELFTK